MVTKKGHLALCMHNVLNVINVPSKQAFCSRTSCPPQFATEYISPQKYKYIFFKQRVISRYNGGGLDEQTVGRGAGDSSLWYSNPTGL